MSDLIERDIYEVANQLGGYVGPDTEKHLAAFLLREAKEACKLADELIRFRDAIAARDREIAELRADCVRKDDHLLAAVQDYNDARQRTIEECAKVADAVASDLYEGQLPHGVAVAIARSIRSLGKEGSGE